MSLRAFGVPASIDALKEEEKKKKRTKSKKGVAVKLGNELDPDYDAEDAEEEEEEDDEERVSVEPRGPLPPWGSMPAPALSLPAFKKAVDATVREFLREADIEACLSAVHDMHCEAFADIFVKRALTAGIEGTDEHRELVSRLLSLSYGLDVTMRQVSNGFVRLLESIDDLELDVPAAREHAAKFIARAVADEIVAPAFVSSPFVASLAEDVLAEARAHLSQPHALARLAHCWGVSGAAFPLSDIKASLGTAISEYYAAGGGAAAAEEALRCVAEAGVPHYAHEAVYRALVRALDTWPDAKRADACVQLLLAAAPAAGAAAAAAAPAPSAGGAGAAGSAAGDAASAGSSAAGSSGLPSSPRAKSAISPLQLATGVRRAAGAICDIEKDAPRAREGLTSIVGRLKAGGALAADFELVMPAPGSAVPLPSPSLSVASSTA